MKSSTNGFVLHTFERQMIILETQQMSNTDRATVQYIKYNNNNKLKAHPRKRRWAFNKVF